MTVTAPPPNTGNKEWLTGILEAIFNESRFSALDASCDEDFILETPSEPFNLAAVDEYLKTWKTGFPDLHADIFEPMEEADQMGGQFTISGTNDGEWEGQPPTGKTINILVIYSAVVLNRSLMELVMVYDRLDLLEQLGHAAVGQAVPSGPAYVDPATKKAARKEAKLG